MKAIQLAIEVWISKVNVCGVKTEQYSSKSLNTGLKKDTLVDHQNGGEPLTNFLFSLPRLFHPLIIYSVTDGSLIIRIKREKFFKIMTAQTAFKSTGIAFFPSVLLT